MELKLNRKYKDTLLERFLIIKRICLVCTMH